MTQATIRTLQDMGASRWTKGNHDRLYIKNIVQDILELDISRYNSGNISSATVLGQKVSNAAAGRILTATDATYIDLKTSTLMMKPLTEKVDGVYTDLTALVKKALETMERAQDSTPEPGTEDLDEETGTTESVQDAQQESKEDTMTHTYTISDIRAMTDDDLTQYTGVQESAGGYKGQFWLVLNPTDGEEIRITRDYDDDEFDEADTPEFYAAWGKRWGDMVAELREMLK